MQTTEQVPDTNQRNANMTHRILVVEDEVALSAGIRDALTHAGFEAEVVHDGAAALESFKKSRFDLIVLDLMLPGKSGLEVLKELRGLRHEVRVVVLTALSDESDVVRGFEMGADDYMAKPFSPRELVARIKAILRRAEPTERERELTLGDVQVRREAREVTVGGEAVQLTGKEFDLLAFFLEHPGIVLSRERLLDAVWELTYPGGTRTVDVHVAQLRRKLGRPDLIRTVRGAGYKAMAAA